MKNKEIIKNIFKKTSARVTLLMTLILSIGFPFVSINYIIPTFEEQIMLNTVNSAKKISHYLYSSYKKNNGFSEIKNIKQDLEIYKIKLFDSKGLTIYSTSKKNIGKINKHSHFHNIVAKGNSYYKIVKKGKKDLEGQIIELDIAEVYIPIMENGIFVNAFEVYYDISPKVKSFDKLILKINTLNFSIILLFIIIVLIKLFNESKLNIQEKRIQHQLFRAEKMDSMSEVIENIAHQWRQPFGVVT